MRKPGSGRTSARSRRAPPRSGTSGRSSSSKGADATIDAEPAERLEKRKGSSASSALNVAALREHLVKGLAWHDAHADFDRAVGGIPVDVRGRKPAGLPYSPWQLLEHLRLTQLDILEFCRNPKYAEPKWPEHYWPKTDSPPTPSAWDASVAGFARDRDELQKLATDPRVDL